MFTFGRKHEIEVALRRHGGPERAADVVGIVNAIHDYIEDKAPVSNALNAIELAMIDGRRDVWDAAGTWLLKLAHSSEANGLWMRLCAHPRAEVRFRVAAFIGDLPNPVAEQMFALLREDTSKKVRAHALERWDMHEHPGKYRSA